MLNKLHVRLLLAFAVLIIIPFYTAGILISLQTRSVQKRQAVEIQKEMALRVGDEFRRYITYHENALLQLIRVRGLAGLDLAAKSNLLAEMLAFNNKFDALILLDGHGFEIAHRHRFRIFFANDLKDRSQTPEFKKAIAGETSYFGPVFFDDESGEPLLRISVPFFRAPDNRLGGTLVGVLRLKPIWDMLAAIPNKQGQQVYILDTQKRVVAHPSPSVVLRGSRYTVPQTSFAAGLNGSQVVLAVKTIRIGDQTFKVVAERSRQDAFAVANRTLYLNLLVGVLALLMIGIMIILMLRQFVRPIRHLALVAQAIEQGDIRRRAEIVNNDEVGMLAQAFNRMTERLRQSLRRLESEVAERKEVELALRESEGKYRLLTENLPQKTFYKDVHSVYVTCNENFARDFYLVAAEIGGKTDYDLFPKSLAEKYRADDKRIIRLGKTEESEEQYIQNGRNYTVKMVKTVVRNQEGQKIGLLGIFWDITAKKRLEEELRQAQKMQSVGTLAGGIAHDFNNILAAVIGYTELCIEDVVDAPELAKNLNEVLIAGKRAKELVKQILTFSRQARQEQIPVQVKRIAQETLKLLKATFPATIEIQHDLRSETYVLGDPTQLHRVLLNLCTNAGHAMQKNGGVLTFNLADTEIDDKFLSKHPDLKHGRYLKLSVSDIGQGMAPETLGRIFDPFFTTKEKGQGTGMGLSVVHGIVKGHGGVIDVRSKPGEGTTFDVYLPAIETSVKPDGDAQKSFPTGTGTILFVDDESALVNIAEIMLRSLGYNVKASTSATEALSIFKEHPTRFDLVITDMTMPSMTGVALSRAIMHIRPDIPIILCTGFSQNIDEKEAKAMGIRAFMSKPVLKRNLAATVHQVLSDASS